MSDAFELKLAEARRYWDLGYYSKASTCFIDAENEGSSLRLATEISGFLISQGCVKIAYDKISEALLTLRDGAEEIEIIMAEILKAMYDGFITTLFSESLKIITQAYEKYLAGVDVEDYTKIHVSMESIYYNQTTLASSLGVSVAGPKTDQDKLAKLFQHCLSKGWFDKARRIASIYVGPIGSIGVFVNGIESKVNRDKLKMLEALVENDSVPAVVRAESLLDLSGLVREANDIQRGDILENEAKKIFSDVGHACGEDLIELNNLRNQSSTQSPVMRRENMLAIKQRLKEQGNWAGVAEAIRGLYEVAMENLDYNLIDKLDEEIDRIKDIYAVPFSWFGWQLTTFRRLENMEGIVAKILPSLEAIHQSLEGTEGIRHKNEAAELIAEIFNRLGDQKRASEWKAKINSAPNYLTFENMMDDPFVDKIRLLNKNSTIAEIKAVDDELHDALERLALEAAETIAISTRWMAVMKIVSICEYYINQARYPARNFHTIKDLVSICSEKGRSLLNNLDKENAILYAGNFLITDALISFYEAGFSGPAPNMDYLKKSAAQFQEGIEHYREAGLHYQLGSALKRQEICYHQLWFASGSLPDSEYFFFAARCCEEAATCYASCGMSNSDAVRLNARAQLQLWLAGYRAKVQLPRDSFPWSSAFYETERCLKNLERLIHLQQHDLSILPMEQALLAKQKLRNDENASLLYVTGIVLYDLEGKPQMVWETLQKSKARSVSDLLGLGINIPQTLQIQIDQNPVAQALLSKEMVILEQINKDNSDGQFRLRTKLEAHRRAMRMENCLQELLDLREGTPVTSAKLRALKNIQQGHGDARQIFFADWFIYSGQILLIVLAPNSTEIFDLGVTQARIEEWRKNNITEEEEPLDDDDLLPLQELSELVKPLVNLSNEGDLLVLCPTSSLHYVPIHAATITKDSKISLIERNPVVYCPSMTVFDQCVTRADSRSKKQDLTKQALLAVYERPSSDVWEEERDDAYSMCKKIAVELGNCAAFTGSEVDKSHFREACETVDTLHFIGHCESKDNALEQHLVITAKTANDANIVEAGGAIDTDKIPHETLVTPEDTFTISDMFATHIQTSHFDLIACASASQRVIGGDEPWGIVTALLCAGATSVSGTQWEIQTGAAREYFSIMYTDVLKRKKESGDGKGTGTGIVVDLAVALQETVKQMKRNPDFRVPFHWAPFVLYGSWFSYY